MRLPTAAVTAASSSQSPARGASGAALGIALVYDLRDEYLARGYSEEETAEFDQPETIDALENALRELGHRVERIGNVEALVGRLLAGERWDLVFNIAEGLHGTGREALVPALLDHFEVPYTFSEPAVAAVSLHKGMAKRIVRDAGIPTAAFAVVESPDEAIALPLPLFLKPVAEGTGKGVTPASRVESRAELRSRLEGLLERYRQPVLVETLLPGTELTVCLAGTGRDAEVLGSLEVRLLPGAEEGIYSYLNKERCESLVDYVRVDPEKDAQVRRAETHALAAWRALGCRDAGRVDLRCDAAGEPFFLEVNPLAGLHPTHSDLPILCRQAGIPYAELVRRIVESARSRVVQHARSR